MVRLIWFWLTLLFRPTALRRCYDLIYPKPTLPSPPGRVECVLMDEVGSWVHSVMVIPEHRRQSILYRPHGRTTDRYRFVRQEGDRFVYYKES